MAEIIVKVDDYTGEIINKGDLVEVTAVLDGQKLRWDFSRSTYGIFRDKIEKFIDCAQVIDSVDVEETLTLQPEPAVRATELQPEFRSQDTAPAETSEKTPPEAIITHSDETPRTQDTPIPALPVPNRVKSKEIKYVSNPPRPRAILLSQENLKKLSESKGRRVLLLRGASLSNFKKQQARAAALGIALIQRNIRSHSIHGNKSNYRICDIYGWKI